MLLHAASVDRLLPACVRRQQPLALAYKLKGASLSKLRMVLNRLVVETGQAKQLLLSIEK